MKLYAKWLFEDERQVPNIEQNLVDAKRIECPQIKDFDAMVDDLSKNGIFIFKQSCNPLEYVPSQNQFDWDKVDKLVKKVKDGGDMYGPVVSRDNVVIDGHHRWLALHHADVDPAKYLTTRVNLAYDQFLDFVKGKPYIEYKGI